jgi:hypothetical protein
MIAMNPTITTQVGVYSSRHPTSSTGVVKTRRLPCIPSSCSCGAGVTSSSQTFNEVDPVLNGERSRNLCDNREQGRCTPTEPPKLTLYLNKPSGKVANFERALTWAVFAVGGDTAPDIGRLRGNGSDPVAVRDGATVR